MAKKEVKKVEVKKVEVKKVEKPVVITPVVEAKIVVPTPVIEVTGLKCVCGALMAEVKKGEFKCDNCGRGISKCAR